MNKHNEIHNENDYMLVKWPKSQDYMGYPQLICLANDDAFREIYGNAAYFVPVWLIEDLDRKKSADQAEVLQNCSNCPRFEGCRKVYDHITNECYYTCRMCQCPVYIEGSMCSACQEELRC